MSRIRCGRWLTAFALYSTVALLMAGCATQPRRSLHPVWYCDLAISNRTPHALEIRLGGRMSAAREIGAINPGELLTYSVPCAQRLVYVIGVPIPSQVGAPTNFRYVRDLAELTEGQRLNIALHWP